jgi:DNA-binding transcriptional ArsR family regulator
MDAARHSCHRELLLLVADPRRWTILRLLGDARLTVTELVERLDIAQPAVSHHLARLRKAGLVESVPEGRTRRYGWASVVAGTPESELQVLLRSWLGPTMPVMTDPGSRPRQAHSGEELEVHLL